MLYMPTETQNERRALPFTPEELAAELRLAPSTIRRHLHTGDIRGFRIGSGTKAPWRIPAGELDRIQRGE